MSSVYAIVSVADESGPGRVLLRGSRRMCRQAMFSGALTFIERGFRVERTGNDARLRVFHRTTGELEIERHLIALDI
ncbi:hypothetical protein [Nocardia terpenica]|uniref:Uncharacterized protein n=1 Tax=Nocardia terpenica TaxID=455432 RepID=A0A164K656_9NOCA|nr:hypothetical protein [Nocardia terpenica]KZM71075.1 hypothetical protein AWN90_41935 [Nocardia terpenica]